MEKRKKDKRTNNGLQNTTQKTKDSETRTIQINNQYIIKIKGGTGNIYWMRSATPPPTEPDINNNG